MTRLLNVSFEFGALTRLRFRVPPQSIASCRRSTTASARCSETCLTYNCTSVFAVNWRKCPSITNKRINDGCRPEVDPKHCSSVTGGGPYYDPELSNSTWHQIACAFLACNNKASRPMAQLESISIDEDQPNVSPQILALEGFTTESMP